MRIIFKKPLNARSLCLMQAQNNGKRPKPLVFDFSPDKFRVSKGVLYFKFIYLREADRLVIGPYDMKHRRIAEHAFGRKVGKNEVNGAILDYQEKNGLMRFTLYGKSGYFGRPEKAQLRRVADHIASRLDSPLIIENDNIVIEGQLPYR